MGPIRDQSKISVYMQPPYDPRDDGKAWLDRGLATDRTVVTNQVGAKLI
jgi:hypothetical protein